MLLVLIRIAIAVIAVGAFFVLTQDFHIFPGLYQSKLFNRTVKAPPSVTEHTLSSGTPVWELQADGELTAIIFHGNADSLESYLSLQEWFYSIGISTYSVEFRGYNGWKNGWPTENGLYEDALEAFALAELDPDKTIVFGNSLGSGIAAYLASRIHPKVLVLVAPFFNLEAVVKETTPFGFLSPFLKFEFPTNKRVAELQDTCVINFHGSEDRVIPVSHSLSLAKLHKTPERYELEVFDGAGHNDVLPISLEKLKKRINECIDLP